MGGGTMAILPSTPQPARVKRRDEKGKYKNEVMSRREVWRRHKEQGGGRTSTSSSRAEAAEQRVVESRRTRAGGMTEAKAVVDKRQCYKPAWADEKNQSMYGDSPELKATIA